MMKTKGKIILATLAAVVILVVIAGLGLKNKIENDLKDVSRINDGVFSGQYTAFPVAAVVEVSVQNSIITNIKLSSMKTTKVNRPRRSLIKSSRPSVMFLPGQLYTSLDPSSRFFYAAIRFQRCPACFHKLG